MNNSDIMSRLLPAGAATLALHGMLLSWQMNRSSVVLPTPEPVQRICVSLQQPCPVHPPEKKVEPKPPVEKKVPLPIKPVAKQPLPEPPPPVKKQIAQIIPKKAAMPQPVQQVSAPLIVKAKKHKRKVAKIPKAAPQPIPQPVSKPKLQPKPKPKMKPQTEVQPIIPQALPKKEVKAIKEVPVQPPPVLPKIIERVPARPPLPKPPPHQPVRKIVADAHPEIPWETVPSRPKPMPTPQIIRQPAVQEPVRKVVVRKKIEDTHPEIPWETVHHRRKPLPTSQVTRQPAVREPVRNVAVQRIVQKAVPHPRTYRKSLPVRQTRKIVGYPQERSRATAPSRTTTARKIRKSSVAPKQVRSTPGGASQGRKGPIQEAAPLYQSNPPPEYPRLARRRGLEGVVMIEAFIDNNGRVADLRLFKGCKHPILNKAALKAVRNWQFTPGTVGGQRQQMWVKVPVRFQLR